MLVDGGCGDIMLVVVGIASYVAAVWSGMLRHLVMGAMR